ncbi:MDR family MFS transporter [Gracilibacillus sp. S3-1-1]|uniref:MDR family MFS transporter n=1 Tax=Gracilibacillus pellucidus TaxID=3095368 RepID=A0ACC6M490_9BACI|nr:MDR family MFS transporter [Gracilibacillus sp. S3-1-1]MDX8045794.1 MDR family MFS transporter [Gracilibacillus sp. S3-1-1]
MNNEGEIKRTPLMIVLMSGAFVAILNQTLLGTALPHIMEDLQIDAATAQWLQSIFMLVNGIMIPVTAFLIERFTTRALFLTAMGSFALGTLVAAIAPSFSVLMIGRVLQAAGAGILMPLMQTIMFLIYPVEKRGTAMGLFGMIIAFAPAIGPTLSGWLVETFPWRSLFYVVLPIAVIDLFIANKMLVNVTKQTYPKLDMLSIILSTLGFGGILYGFSMAGDVNHEWLSTMVLIPLIVGAIALFFFIRRQFKLEKPILEFRIFKYNMFTLTTVIGMVSFLAMIGGAIIIPLMMQDSLGFNALHSGLALLPGAVLMGIMNPVTGRLFDKFGAKWLAVIGLAILSVTTFLFAILTTDTSYWYIVIVNAIRMLGIAMVMMPVTTAGLNTLPNEVIQHGTAMNNTMRQMSGALGTALLVSVMISHAIPEDGLSGMIHGVNMSFLVAGFISVVGFILAFFIKNSNPRKTA